MRAACEGRCEGGYEGRCEGGPTGFPEHAVYDKREGGQTGSPSYADVVAAAATAGALGESAARYCFRKALSSAGRLIGVHLGSS